jgi:hypothetical protein
MRAFYIIIIITFIKKKINLSIWQNFGVFFGAFVQQENLPHIYPKNRAVFSAPSPLFCPNLTYGENLPRGGTKP